MGSLIDHERIQAILRHDDDPQQLAHLVRAHLELTENRADLFPQPPTIPPTESVPGVLRASSAGRCNRDVAYQWHGYVGRPLPWRTKLVYRMGDLVEADLAGILLQYGATDYQALTNVSEGGLTIRGHIDLLFHGRVVDIKSTTTYGMRRAKGGDYGDYAEKMHVYMRSHATRESSLLYYVKEDSELYEARVPWDDGVWEQVVRDFHTVVNSPRDQLPEREYGPDEKGALPWQCRYCSYCRECWPQAELSVSAKGKPVLTIPTQLPTEVQHANAHD